MATHRLPLQYTPDGSAYIYPSLVTDQLSLASAAGNELCMVMADPNGAGDKGVYGTFQVPQNYAGTPVLHIQGILDGAPSTTTIAFGVQMDPIADDETYDAALESEDTASASSVSQADEDLYEETISLSNTFAAGDSVTFFFYIDDATHSYTGNFLLKELSFQYSDT